MKCSARCDRTFWPNHHEAAEPATPSNAKGMAISSIPATVIAHAKDPGTNKHAIVEAFQRHYENKHISSSMTESDSKRRNEHMKTQNIMKLNTPVRKNTKQ